MVSEIFDGLKNFVDGFCDLSTEEDPVNVFHYEDKDELIDKLKEYEVDIHLNNAFVRVYSERYDVDKYLPLGAAIDCIEKNDFGEDIDFQVEEKWNETYFPGMSSEIGTEEYTQKSLSINVD